MPSDLKTLIVHDIASMAMFAAPDIGAVRYVPKCSKARAAFKFFIDNAADLCTGKPAHHGGAFHSIAYHARIGNEARSIGVENVLEKSQAKDDPRWQYGLGCLMSLTDLMMHYMLANRHSSLNSSLCHWHHTGSTGTNHVDVPIAATCTWAALDTIINDEEGPGYCPVVFKSNVMPHRASIIPPGHRHVHIALDILD